MPNHKQILIIFILLTSLSNAQIKIHKHITTDDGLVSNHIQSMIQDSKGYIWFATFDGVSKWDGKHFENFTKTTGLTAAQVFDIEEGPDSTIYIANFLGRLQTYKNGKLSEFNMHELPELKFIADIYRAPDSVIYFLNGGELQRYKNNKIERLSKKFGIPRVGYEDIYQNKSGRIFLATWNGLYILENDTSFALTAKDGLNHNRVRRICEDKNGVLFIGTLTGVNTLKNGKISQLKYKGKPIHDNIFDIIRSKDDKIYITGDNGVYIVDNETITHLTEEDGLSDNDILSAMEDYNGTIYFGTQEYGVDIYHPERLESYKITSNLLNGNIISIFEDNHSQMYFGLENGLVLDNSQKLNLLNSANGIFKGRVNTIFQSSSNSLFLGCEYGLNKKVNGKFIKYTLNLPGKDQNQIYSIVETSEDNFLIASESGLLKFRSSTLQKIKSKERGLSSTLTSLLKLNDNTTIIGTHGFGIVYFNGDVQNIINTKNGLSDNVITTLHLSKSGKVLVGTDHGGLNIIEKQTVVDTIDINNGLSSNTIMDISEDKIGNIFLSTTRGLNIIQHNSGKYIVRTINVNDGLVSNNLNRNATFMDNNGVLWIGTNKGVSKYNPKADKPITNPPKVYLTGLEIFNKKYPLEKFRSSKQLEYDQNYLKFIFTGINLSAPDKLLYKYKLNGVDRNWVEGRNNYANYTSLHKGKYTFEVKARNEWGYWSKPVSVAFIINPAWWETWWFRLAVISALGFLLWLAFQYRLNYLLKLERLRTKIASDLHDDVGSLLTQISINVDSLSYTKDETKRKEKRKFIGEKSKEVINMMSDVIWSIDSRNDTMESLVDRIQNFAQSFAEQKDISLEFVNEIKDMKKSLKIDFRQNVMMIAKEAINNSIKYSDCTKIKIVLSYKNNQFEMIISDDGKGIDFENIKRGNGLKNMKMRAELIDAKIDFVSEDGCTVHLIKPKLY